MDGYGNFPITSEALSGPIRITEIAGFIFVPFLMWTSSGRNDLLFLNPTLKSNFSRHQLDFGSSPLGNSLRNSLGFTFCAIFVDFLIGVHKNPPVRQLEELQSSRLRLHGRHHCRHREASTPPPFSPVGRSRFWSR